MAIIWKMSRNFANDENTSNISTSKFISVPVPNKFMSASMYK